MGFLDFFIGAFFLDFLPAFFTGFFLLAGFLTFFLGFFREDFVDFETEIIVTDLNHLLEILEEVVKRFSNVIRSYDYMGYSSFPRLTMVPD